MRKHDKNETRMYIIFIQCILFILDYIILLYYFIYQKLGLTEKKQKKKQNSMGKILIYLD